MAAAAGPDRLRVEMHCHTCYSPDSLLRPADLLARARARGLDRVAITDHNTIEGALHAQRIDPPLVVVGEEILTTKGELLAYYLTEGVPTDLEPLVAIERLRQQGAIISVSHPFDHARSGAWRPADLEAILPHVDALEVFNARAISPASNRRAGGLAARARLLCTAGSDAHAYPEVGRVVMALPDFWDAESMRRALREAEILGRRSPSLVHLYSRYASWRKHLGWHPPDTST